MMDLLDESWGAEHVQHSLLERIKELETQVEHLQQNLDTAFRRIHELEDG